jgi:hypothetical protein
MGDLKEANIFTPEQKFYPGRLRTINYDLLLVWCIEVEI